MLHTSCIGKLLFLISCCHALFFALCSQFCLFWIFFLCFYFFLVCNRNFFLWNKFLRSISFNLCLFWICYFRICHFCFLIFCVTNRCFCSFLYINLCRCCRYTAKTRHHCSCYQNCKHAFWFFSHSRISSPSYVLIFKRRFFSNPFILYKKRPLPFSLWQESFCEPILI